MWPNAALSDLIRGWQGTLIGDRMADFEVYLESIGYDTKKYWNPEAIAGAIESGQKNNQIRSMLEAMYDTDWEDEIRAWSRTYVHEQYGPELGDLCLLQNLVYFI